MESEERIKGRIAKNSVVIFLARAFDIGSGIFSVALITRYLGPDLYGQYAWIWAYILFFQPLVNFELDKILIRDIARMRENAGEIVGSAMVIKWIFLLFFVIALALITPLFKDFPLLYWAVAISAISEILYHHSMIFNSVFNGFEKMEYETFLTVLSRSAILLGIIVVVILDLGFLALFWSFVAGNLLKAIAGYLIISKKFLKIKIKFEKNSIEYLLKEASFLTLAAFLTHTAFKIDVYILKWLKTAKDVALFNLPHIMVMQFQILPLAFVGALFPVLSRQSAISFEKFKSTFRQAFMLLIATAIPISFFVCFFSKKIILLISGKDYLDSVLPMQILAWTVGFLFINFLFSTTLISFKKQKFIPISSATTLSLNLVLDLILVPRYSYIGAAVGTLSAYGAGAIVLMLILFHQFKKMGKSGENFPE